MIAYNTPSMFWLLVLIPILLLVILWASFTYKKNTGRFSNPELYNQLTGSLSVIKRNLRTVFFMTGLFFLILAITGPRFGTKTEIVKRMGIDIVIGIDTSYSMLAEDIKPNRIMQAKYEIQRLIDNLQGDRVALIAFSGDAVVQCPFTSDYGAARTLLDYIDAGIVPKPGTNLEISIIKSIELLKRSSGSGSQSQLVILFTDGESIEGDPENAAKRAASIGVRIFTVGIGTTGGEIIPIRNETGQITDYKKDESGNIVKTTLDEKTLKRIADITKGTYIRTERGEVDVQSIIEELGSIHKSSLHERKISRLKERYQLPLGISLLFLIAWFSLRERKQLNAGKDRLI